MDDASGEVKLYSNGDRYGRSMMGPNSRNYPQKGKPFYGSDAEAVALARQKLETIGWHCGPDVHHKPLPVPDQRGDIARAVLYFTFSEKPYGYDASRIGNFAVIGLDSLEGEVVELQRSFGYTYEAPEVVVSRTQAIGIARGVADVGPDPQVIGPSYVMLSMRVDALSDRGRSLCQAKQLPIAFYVFGRKETVLVAAKDGDVLGKYSSVPASGSGKASKTERPTPPSDAGGPRKDIAANGAKPVEPAVGLPSAIPVLGAVLAIGAVLGWLLFRRS